MSSDYDETVARLRLSDNDRCEQLFAEVERLQGIIDRAYGIAQEMSHDDHQALVCVIEVLEVATR